MNYELSLIVLLLKYNNYNKYKDIIDIKYLKENYKEIYYIYNTLEELININKKDITKDELITFFYTKYNDQKNNAAYEALFLQINNININDDVGNSILAALKQRNTALKLSETAYKFTQGFSSLEDIQRLTEEFKVNETKSSATPVDTDLEVLLNSTAAQQGIRWRLQFLNKSIGSLRPGDMGMLIARPESGKTLFCVDMAMNAIDQVERPILYFNAEEADNKVLIRCYMSYFGATIDQLKSNWRKYNEVFQERVSPKFKFYGLEYCTKQTTDAIVKEQNPSMVIYDQLSKWKGFSSDRLDLQLGAQFQFARELTKFGDGHVGWSAHQADGTAEGQRWLDMGHVANSKTQVTAELDVILGLGKTADPNEESLRFFNISKNKLLGDSDSDPNLRHGRGEVIIHPDIMRFTDILNYE